MTNTLRFAASCPECGFTSQDVALLNNHSCAVTQQGGRCEDYPACGHEAGDCNGLLYGSDEHIKQQVYDAWRTGHGHCDHENGIYDCETYDDYEEEEGDEGEEQVAHDRFIDSQYE
jgi:hypothetical protein